MCSSLSEEARLELQEMCEESGPAIDAAINEAISDEQLDLAIDTIIHMEASVPSCSSKAAAKRKIVTQIDDDDDFQNPAASHEAPALPSRGKNMHPARKNMRPSSSVRSLSPTLSTSSSTTSDDSEDWLKIINEELQRRAEFRQRVDGKMNNIKKKIKSTEDLISRIKGKKSH
ncbi:uncharacterized protein LOC108909912 [Anoplophora glabripennis]|uniref:uncharacterized protein LOC108909912 n=1 Tax=Anoplophora glabripennis TaxID=217634 RepID=UPI000873BE14|nr:uncharacterized protein LOC108909912 [Anoplophora glabripennis]